MAWAKHPAGRPGISRHTNAGRTGSAQPPTAMQHEPNTPQNDNQPQNADQPEKHLGEPYTPRDTSATEAAGVEAMANPEATGAKTPGPAAQTPGDIGDNTIDRDEGDTSIGGTSITNV